MTKCYPLSHISSKSFQERIFPFAGPTSTTRVWETEVWSDCCEQSGCESMQSFNHFDTKKICLSSGLFEGTLDFTKFRDGLSTMCFFWLRCRYCTNKAYHFWQQWRGMPIEKVLRSPFETSFDSTLLPGHSVCCGNHLALMRRSSNDLSFYWPSVTGAFDISSIRSLLSFAY